MATKLRTPKTFTIRNLHCKRWSRSSQLSKLAQTLIKRWNSSLIIQLLSSKKAGLTYLEEQNRIIFLHSLANSKFTTTAWLDFIKTLFHGLAERQPKTFIGRAWSILSFILVIKLWSIHFSFKQLSRCLLNLVDSLVHL